MYPFQSGLASGHCSSEEERMPRTITRLYLMRLIAGLVGLSLPCSYGETSAQPKIAPENMHIYLLIGQSNIAGRAGVPEAATAVLERCYLLNDKNEWEQAGKPIQILAPEYGFVRKMLAQNKDIRIGLVPGTCDGKKIDDWLGKSECYWAARKRLKVATRNGTFKGALWYQGDGDNQAPEGYIEKLKSIIANLRTDTGDTSTPFVAGQIHHGPAIHEQLAKLPETVHATASVSCDGLTTTDAVHFDQKSQLLLGERYAEQMMRVQALTSNITPKPPADLKFIDPHIHATSVTPTGLDAVAKWMDERNVERCIVSPLSHQGSRPKTEQERDEMLAHFRKYQGRIDRMCLIEPDEVKSVDEAVTILKREIADGAIAFGEHYGVNLMFDDPKNLMLYEACEKVGLPVMFHIDQNKNMVEPGMARVDRVLKMFPKCKVVAHAYWWRQLKDGTCDRQLRENPNLYADMSGSVVVNVLNRDRIYAREFLIRNQDKILWATDEGWWSFGSSNKQLNQHYTFFEELKLPDEVRRKIYRENAEKVYGLKHQAP